MKRASIAIAIIVLLDSGIGAQGACRIVVGPGSITGAVNRPQSYLDAVESLARVQMTFDNMPVNCHVLDTDLGGFVLRTGRAGTSVMTREGLVAGAEPPSVPHAVLVTRDDAIPPKLAFELIEPTVAMGFVLMGGGVSSQLLVSGAQGILGSAVIPAGALPQRRWIGVFDDAAEIHRVELQAIQSGAFGLDDIELGFHAPEPATLLWWICGLLMACRSRRRRAGSRY